MRPTMFEQSVAQQVNNTLQKHIQDLQLLIAGGDTSSTSRCALEALNIIKNIEDEQAPLFTKSQINALLVTPAITDDWHIILMYLQMKNLNLDYQEKLADFLIEVSRDRNNERQDLLFRTSTENKDELSRIYDRQDRLQVEVTLLHQMRYVINTIKNPVPEFSELTALLDSFANDHINSIHDKINSTFYRICPLIANANDPRLALRQAIRYADKIEVPAILFWKLKDLNKDDGHFNQFLNAYKSDAGIAHKKP